MNCIIRILICTIFLVNPIFTQDRYESFPTWLKSVPEYGIDGMKNSVTDKSNLMIIGAVGLGTLLAYQVDDKVQNHAQREGLLPDRISQFGDLYGNFWSGWLLPVSVIITSQIEDDTKREMLEKLEYTASALVANGVITVVLKEIIGRERPDGSSNRSMPSGHTSHSFAVAAVADELYGHKVGIAAYLIAGIVAASRINDNKHYLSDVIVGAGLGTIIGRGFAKTYRNSRFEINGDMSININYYFN